MLENIQNKIIEVTMKAKKPIGKASVFEIINNSNLTFRYNIKKKFEVGGRENSFENRDGFRRML